MTAINAIVYIIFSFWFIGFDFYKAWTRTLKINSSLEEQNLRHQLKALKNQINPHFLFNNLNTLSDIIREDPIKAEKFVVEFSNVYRHLLVEKDNILSTIEDELEFLDSFIYLINIRFKDQLIINIERENLSSFYIAPMVLQLLIENAIKHNETSYESPLKIDIYTTSNHLIVENNIQYKLSVSYSSGIGLSNIQERYALMSDKPILIEEDMTCFRVSIPILKHKNNKTLGSTNN